MDTGLLQLCGCGGGLGNYSHCEGFWGRPHQVKSCQVQGALGGRDGTFWCSLAYTCVVYGHQAAKVLHYGLWGK